GAALGLHRAALAYALRALVADGRRAHAVGADRPRATRASHARLDVRVPVTREARNGLGHSIMRRLGATAKRTETTAKQVPAGNWDTSTPRGPVRRSAATGCACRNAGTAARPARRPSDDRGRHRCRGRPWCGWPA